MRAAYRQSDAGPVVNVAHNPRGTAYQVVGQFVKWQNDRWSADGTYTLLTGITGHPDGITTAVRLTTTTTPRNNHGFHLAGNPEAGSASSDLLNMLPARPGERLTVSFWLRYTGTATQGYRIKFRSANADGSAWVTNSSLDGPTVSLPSGVWVRLSLTYTVPEGSSFVSLYVTNITAVSDAIGDTIDGTGLMVTRTPPPRANIATDPYATRTPIPARQFGWNIQWFGSGGSGTTTPITNATDGPNGIATYLRKTWTAIGANVQNVAFNHASTGSTRPPVTQGEAYSLSSYFRASKGWTVTQHCRIVVEWYDANNVLIGSAIQGANIPIVTAGVWYKLEISNIVAPPGAVAIFVYQNVYVQNGSWAPGDTIDGTGLMVTRDNAQIWKFADGSSPGWKWLGAVNTSESAGYAIPG